MTAPELKALFPWLGTDEEVSGADVIDRLNHLYGLLKAAISITVKQPPAGRRKR